MCDSDCLGDVAEREASGLTDAPPFVAGDATAVAAEQNCFVAHLTLSLRIAPGPSTPVPSTFPGAKAYPLDTAVTFWNHRSMAPLNYSRLEPVASWPGGLLRVCHDPARSDGLAPAESYLPYGTGYAIPAANQTVPQLDGVTLSVEYVDGALRLVGLEIVDQPDTLAELRAEHGMKPRNVTRWLTGKYLRSVPVDRRLAEAAQQLAVRLYRRPRGEVIGVHAYESHIDQAITTDDLAALSEAGEYLSKITADAIRGESRRGRRPIPVETLARAAEIAREADAAGESRSRAITHRMCVQESTAKKYLRRAREAGMLPPSSRGRRSNAS